MSCANLVEVVTEWTEGALSDSERVQVEEHLAICPHCVDYLTQLRRSIEVFRELPRSAAPSAARSALLDEFRRRAT